MPLRILNVSENLDNIVQSEDVKSTGYIQTGYQPKFLRAKVNETLVQLLLVFIQSSSTSDVQSFTLHLLYLWISPLLLKPKPCFCDLKLDDKISLLESIYTGMELKKRCR